MLEASQFALLHPPPEIQVASDNGPPEGVFEVLQPSGAPAVLADILHHAKKGFPDQFIVGWVFVAHELIISAFHFLQRPATDSDAIKYEW
jgi:hypothetical protein